MGATVIARGDGMMGLRQIWRDLGAEIDAVFETDLRDRIIDAGIGLFNLVVCVIACTLLVAAWGHA